MKYSSSLAFTIVTSIATITPSVAFSPLHTQNKMQRSNKVATSSSSSSSSLLSSSSSATTTSSSTTEDETKISFIDTELRGAAMKLHTKSQAPKEGEAKEQPKPANAEPYIPTHMDYLKFLVDSQFVYKTFEEILLREELHPELQPFVNTGLERNDRLEEDIVFMTKEYDLDRPEIGDKGKMYAEMMESIAAKGKENIPEFMCHYYNYYFAHTAGGRMIGKQMASLLLEKKTLEFYKVRH